MSLEAMVWALKKIQIPKDPTAKLVLVALADHAMPDGSGAYPSQKTLAEYVGASVRTVASKLLVLEHDFKIIVRGDQQLVKHIPANRRPVVYNLQVGMQILHGMQDVHAPDVQDLHGNGSRHEIYDAPGMKLFADKPSFNPSTSNSSREGSTSRAEKLSTAPHREEPIDNRKRLDRCLRHQDDPNPPACGHCADARRDAPRVERERIAADRARRRAAAVARSQDRSREIAACPDCRDTDGRINGQICQHNPHIAEAAVRGAAANRTLVRPTVTRGAPR